MDASGDVGAQPDGFMPEPKHVAQAKQEAEFYLAKMKSVVTAKMIARIKKDPRFGLAAIG